MIRLKIEKKKYLHCGSGTCPKRLRCAQHEHKGDPLAESGFTPILELAGTASKPAVYCRKEFSGGAGALVLAWPELVPAKEYMARENPIKAEVVLAPEPIELCVLNEWMTGRKGENSIDAHG